MLIKDRSLRAFLDIRGFANVRVLIPPPSLCTDNAAMIAWTGIEMYEAGWESQLSCKPLRKWSVDPNAEDGGILGVAGWTYCNRNCHYSMCSIPSNMLSRSEGSDC
jgi:hypothetical protein